MTTEMREMFNHWINDYKQLRNELNADTELSDTEKDWMLTNIRQSIQYQSQLLELDLT